MENQLTKEQAINNIKIVLEKFIGTKAEHIILENSLNLILNEGTN